MGLEIKYHDGSTKTICSDIKRSTKFFGGRKELTVSLMSRIQAIQNAETIKDIILMPSFHFHKLKGDLEGLFSIDVKSRSDKWRLIIRPLDENGNTFDPCNIDEIANKVKIIEVMEVSAHYE